MRSSCKLERGEQVATDQTAGQQLLGRLGATPLGTACRIPGHGAGRCGSCLKQHDSATSTADLSRDAGREWAAGATGQSTHQTGARTSRRHWTWTRMGPRTTGGPEEQHGFGAATRTSAWWSNHLLAVVTVGHCPSLRCNRLDHLLLWAFNQGVARGFAYCRRS